MRAGLIVILIIMMRVTFAQDYPREAIDLSQFTNDMLSFQDESVSYEDLYENYAQLLSHPINLNKTTADELRLLGALSENQIDELLTHVEKNGALISVYELQSLSSYDAVTIEKVAPFVTVQDPKQMLNKSFVRRAMTSDVYLISRWQRALSENSSSSDARNKYLGSPDKLYNRFRASSPNDYSIGFTAEKDAGELMAWSPAQKQYGFDHLSWHIQLKNKWQFKNLIIGDYQYQFAQGLVLGSGFGFGKSAETINSLKKSDIGFLPNTSANESGFMRGAAVTVALLPKVSLSSFYSSVMRDGSVNQAETSETFSSIIVSGLHRTETELSKRKVIRENNMGMVAEYKTRATDIGLLYNEISFSVPAQKTPSPYNQFAFSGSVNRNVGAFFSTTFDNVNFFGEAAHTLNQGYGLVAGALATVSRSTDVSLLFRKYDRDFQTFYANALSENTTPQNETGLYWGLKTKLSSRFTASAYVDIFQFPWLKFRVYKPSTGNEVLGRLQYQPSKKALLFIQWRREQKAQNASEEFRSYQINKRVKTNVCLHAEYYITENIKLKSRLQMSEVVTNANTSGMALIQDITFKSGKFKFSGRYALFDTDDFDNRQYVYENDMLMAFSFPAYQGTGIRQYILVEYKLNKQLTVSGRYSQTMNRADVPGLQNERSIKCQALIRL
jgi:hypothetical protein